MQDAAADHVVDARLEGVLGDHQVGGSAADVDAGDADGVFQRRRRPPAPRAAARPGRGGGAIGPRRRPAGGGRSARGRRFGRLRRGPLAAVLVQRAEPQPRVLAEHPHLAPDVSQVDGAGLVDAQIQLGPDALALAQGEGEDIDRLLRLGGQAALLLLDHAAGESERKGADFARPPGVARGRPIGRRVDVGIRLAEHFVERGGHHRPRGVARLQRRLRGKLLRVRIAVQQEVAVVLMDVAQQRPAQQRGIQARLAAVGRVGHVPVGPFQPTGVVGPEIALRRTQTGADVALGPHDLQQVVGLGPHADHRQVIEQRRGDLDFDLVGLRLLFRAEPARLFGAGGAIFDLRAGRRRQIGRVAPVGLRGEPARAGQADRLGRVVPGVHVVAVVQLEGHHLRRLGDLADHLQQQRTGAAVAEIDDHVDVLRVAGCGRGRPDAKLHGRQPPQRLAVDVQQALQANLMVAHQRLGRAEIADLRIAAGRIDRQEQPRRAGLDDLPLDIRDIRSGASAAAAAAAALPAVAALRRGVSPPQRHADDLDTRVGEEDVHGEGLGVRD